MGQNVDAAQVANQIAAAIAGAVANAAPAAPPAAVFALTPALAETGILDYKQKSGSDIYKTATASLKTLFKGETPNLRTLTNELTTRAKSFGWERILTVTMGAGNPDLEVHRHYNAMTLDQVKTYVNTYIDVGDRNQQNDYQLYVCLNATVDEATLKMMSSLSEDYTCGVNDDKTSGVLYLKVLLAKSAPQAKAMATQARTNIMDLHVYMKDTAKDNVKLLHEHVKSCIAQLLSVNQTSTDIETALFKAYAACKDKKFREYADRLQDKYNEDMTDTITYPVIMAKTENVYTIRMTAKTWLQLSDEQVEIHALRGQVQALTGAVKQVPNAPRAPKGPPTRPSGGGIDAAGKRKAKFDRIKPEWRKIKPKHGESHTKNVNGVEWFYCIHHGYWVQHKSDECRDKPAGPATTTEADIRAAIADVGVEQLDDDDSEHEL